MATVPIDARVVPRGGRERRSPLVLLIRSQPGMAPRRLLAEHADDGTGHRRVCSAGAQTGAYPFPFAIGRAADEATDDAVVGSTADDVERPR